MSTSTSSSSSPIRMSGLASGLDTESIVSSLMSAQRYKAQKIQNKITTTQWKQDIWKGLNKKIYSFYTGSLYKLKMQSNFKTKKVTSSDETNATVSCNSAAIQGTNTLQIKQLATAQIVTGAKVSNITTSTKLTDTSIGFVSGDKIKVTAGTKETDIAIDDKTTVSDLLTKLSSAGVNASYDSTQGRFYLSSKDSGTANKFTIASTNDTSLKGLNALGIGEIDGTAIAGDAEGKNKVVIAATDASIVYNGVVMTPSSNTVNVNGLTINLKAKTTDDEVINLNVGNDTDSVYNMVKTFVTDYNTLLKELYTDYDADTAKGYTPLTDDQKSAMSDTEVEKWETKIKDSLLRRDDNLGSIVDSMRTTMSGMIKVDGKSYSLATYGITSTSYTENGQLHINGNPDDSEVATLTDKLKTALSSDPDTVAQVLTGLATKLYTSFSDNMKSTTLRSALTMYNDKELTQQVTDYTEDLDTLNDKLNDMETRYYKQFTAMETAMAKMNSQSSSLTSMLSSS